MKPIVNNNAIKVDDEGRVVFWCEKCKTEIKAELGDVSEKKDLF